MFGVGTQEDASEFFTTLLEHMAKAIKFSSSSSPNQFNGAVNGKHNANNKRSHTILDDIFAFQFRSRSNLNIAKITEYNTFFCLFYLFYFSYVFELWSFVRYRRRYQHMAARSQVCSRHTKRHASFSQGGDLGRRERLQMRKVYI